MVMLQVLKIEAIGQLYAKHKVFFYRQIMKNNVTQEILKFLQCHYETCSAPVESLVKQLRILSGVVKDENCLTNLKVTIVKIEEIYKCANKGLLDSIEFIIQNTMKNSNYVEMIKFLESFLNYKKYANKPLYVVYNWLTNAHPQEGEADGSWELQQGLNPDDTILGIACNTGRNVDM